MKLFLGALCSAGVLVFLIVASGSNEAGTGDAELRLIVTQVPTGGLDAQWSQGAALSTRYPSGSRIVLVEPGAEREGVVRVLSEGLDAAGAPSLSPLGDQVLFAGRARPDSSWCIYEAALTGGGPEQRVEVSGDCGDPAYLPGGEMIFVVNGDDDDPAGGSFLCKASSEGEDVQRVTFGPGMPSHPTVLRDGRVLFSMQADPDGALLATDEPALFTVNPDGTMIEPFTGLHDELGVELRARQTAGNRILFLAGADASSPQTIAWVDFARPMAGRGGLEATIAEGPSTLDVTSVEPFQEGSLVVTGRASSSTAKQTSGAYLIAPEDEQAQTLFDDPQWNEVEALVVTERLRPRARPSSIAAEKMGTLVCYDAASSDGVHGPLAGAPPPVEVSVETSASAAELAGIASERVVQVEPGIVELGRVAVAPDNSFFVRVPADVPLRVRSFDSGSQLISTSGWFWIRPGETRACFGCHERRDTAPPNRIIQAIAQPPQELGATSGEAAE